MRYFNIFDAMVNILYGVSGAATLWAIYDSSGVALFIIAIMIAVALIDFHVRRPR